MCWNPLCKVPFTCVIPLWNWINSPQRDILKSLNKRQPYKPALNVKDEWSLSLHALCEKHAWVPSPAQSAASMEAMEIISLTILPLSSQPVHHLPQCQLSQACLHWPARAQHPLCAGTTAQGCLLNHSGKGDLPAKELGKTSGYCSAKSRLLQANCHAAEQASSSQAKQTGTAEMSGCLNAATAGCATAAGGVIWLKINTNNP